MKRTLAVIFGLLVAALPMHGVTRNWTGAVDNKLNTAGNWNPAGSPASGDWLKITGTGIMTVVNDLPPSTVVQVLRVTEGYVNNYPGSLALHVTGDPFVNAAAIDAEMLGTLYLDSGISVAQHADISGFSVYVSSLYVASGATANLSGATVETLSGSGSLVLYGKKIANASGFNGQINVQGSGTIDATLPSVPVVVHYPFDSSAVLRGTGRLGDTTVNDHLDPGPDSCIEVFCPLYAHTIGTLTVDNLTVAGPHAETVIDFQGPFSDVISASAVSLDGTLSVFATGENTPGTVLRIIDNRGGNPINGTFAGLPEGARFSVTGSSSKYTISYKGSDGNDVTLTAGGHATLTLTAPQYGQPSEVVPLSAHVSWGGGPPPSPAGTVKFAISGAPDKVVPLDANGDASALLFVSAGMNAITATYADTGIYDGDTKNAEVWGGKRTPTIVAQPQTNPSPLGQSFTLLVSLDGAVAPTGALTITEGGTSLAAASVQSNILIVPIPPLPGGAHALTLAYSGDAVHAPATSTITVNVATSAAGFHYAEGPGSSLTLDLTVPATPGPYPLILAIETDSWSAMPKTQTVALREVGRGWAVATARFRTTFPGQIADLKAAVRWLRANAARFNLQPSRIVAWGIGPAGGQLASLLGTSASVTSFDDPAEANPDVSSRLEAVIDWSGADDLATFGTCGAAARAAASALGEAARPASYASTDDPPFLLMHGANDCTVGPAAPAALAAALRSAGVDTTSLTVNGAGSTGSGWDAASVTTAVDDFLDQKSKSTTSRRRAVRP